MSLTDLLSQLDPRPGVRGRQFERLCGWYLRNAPEYRHRIRQVWLWSEWPGAWAADAGIDLVAEDRDGGLWAVQAKAYAPSYAIKKADVDSFLSESSRPQFSFRLLIATTDLLGPTARRTLDAQREPVGYLLRSQLELAQVVWPSSLSDLRPRRPPRKKPFPHVREGIEAAAKGFADVQRGQLIMACGTGKTLAAMWISERLDSQRTLVLLPSLSLLAQTLREWAANASGPFEYLAVCSDPTVVGEDQLVEHTTELGFPATTDPDAIAAFLRRRGRRVVFATYQSSPQVASAFDGRTPRFDLAIADEAHRCAGRTSSEFATILDAARIKSRRRLFMTATPRFYTARVRSEAGQFGVELASMDDEDVFGPVLHRLTFGEAIERDLLSDYQVVVVGVDDEMYRAWADRGEFVARDGETVTDARRLASQIGLAKTMRKYDLRRIISFHGRVKAAREFSAEIPSVIHWMPDDARPSGVTWSEHVSGAMTSGHRDRLLLRFRELALEERGLLSNARCLGEGVDVPSIDGIAFIDPRRSTIDIVQALGRAIRKSADKRLGTIVLPVFLSATEDPDQALNESAFEHVWDVLKALRAHDETLGEELDELRRRLGARRGAPRRPGRIKLDVPRRVGAGFVRAFDVRLVEQTTASWEFYFGLLQRFVEREGHARVPEGTREDGYNLAVWVNTQRTRRARGELEHDRERKLEEVPGWVWDVLQAWWDEGFAYLQQFFEREGHARVPDDTREDGYNLGGWATRQRQVYRRGTLDPDRRRRLEALPGWSWRPDEDAWEEGFSHLHAFVEREGHARVPTDIREDGYRLGSWVTRQRTRRARGELDPDRERRLDRVPGWTWNVVADAWEEGFAYLQQFAEREGHARVPEGTREHGYRLAAWVNKQRTRRARGELEPNRERRLEGVPGWVWDVRQAAWEEGFAYLQQFVERKGNAKVPGDHREDGYRLGQWLGVQRATHRQGQLAKERVRRLEALPGWTWTPFDSAWERGFGRLQSYLQSEGHSRIPYSYRDRDGFKLGTWVSRQRRLKQKGTLSDDRTGRLEALPGWTWSRSPWGDAWDEAFERLRSYIQREGHSWVPWTYRDRDGYMLGQWAKIQRRGYQKETLSDERTRRLESLPTWTWSDEGGWRGRQEASYEAVWEQGFNHLRNFAEREGHARVSGAHREDGYPLGQWVNTQRTRRAQGELEPDRERRLEEVPGWTWSDRQAAWEEGFARLRSYVDREGHARVPAETLEDGYRLGAWVNNQRTLRARGGLDPDRERELDGVPGWTWDVLQALWDEGFGYLQQFVEREGHARVPVAALEDGYRLGAWVDGQRQSYRQGKLSDQRARSLQALPGWTWTPQDYAWEEGYSHLRHFAEREEHTQVPQAHREDGYRLGGWVKRQRTQEKNGTLPNTRRERLEALPGWTWSALPGKTGK